MKTKLYVGVKPDTTREVFRASQTPTKETHGNVYAYTIGPFRTKGGADFMAEYGKNNPHCRCVAEAEKLAKQEKNKAV